MTLQPEAKEGNIERSLTEWIRAKLVTIEGLTVHFSDEPADDRPGEWVHVDYLLGMRRDFGRKVGRTNLGSRGHGIVNFNLARKRQGLTNIYAMAILRDKVIAYFMRGQTIPLKDYDTGGNPVAGGIEVHSVTQSDVDDGRESGVIVRALAVNITYIEAYALV